MKDILEKTRLAKRYVVHHDWTRIGAAALILLSVYLAFIWAPPINAPLQSEFVEGGSYFASGKQSFTVDGASVTGPASIDVSSIEETGSEYVVTGALNDGREATIKIQKSDVNSVIAKEGSGGDISRLVLDHSVFQGESWRIFYFHVGISWVMALAFFHTFVASLAYLRTEGQRWDTVAAASAEIGFVMATLVLVTGSIWAKPAWGTWWNWDPRLTTSLVLWLVYGGYLGLRGEGMERQSAVYGVLAFASVPLTFVSIRLWRTVHPTTIDSAGVNMGSSILLVMMVALVAMTFLFIHVMSLRVKLGLAEEKVEQAKRSIRE